MSIALWKQSIQHYKVAIQASLGPPCLSFDIIPEQSKADFPLSVTAVAGTQASKVGSSNLDLEYNCS